MAFVVRAYAFPDGSPCGLGGPQSPGGPCTGGSGPDSGMSDGFLTALSGGHTQVFSICLAVLGILAVLVLFRLVRSSLGAKRNDAEAQRDDVNGQGLVCRKCGVEATDIEDPDYHCCDACGFIGVLDYGTDDDSTVCCVCGELSSIGVMEDGVHAHYCQDHEPEDLFSGGFGDGEEYPDGEHSAVDFAQTGPGFTTCAACGFPDDPEDIENNGGVCNDCRREADHEKHATGGIGGSAFR